jgi:hypothetical protein
MTPHRLFPIAVLASVLVLLLAGCASSQEEVVDSRCAGRVDADRRPECASSARWSEEWKESRTMLPPAPQDDDLVPIEAPRAQAGYDYFIDRKSISRGADGVMRYTVVARSPSGTRNSFHEGLRCFDDTVRTYGFASSDGVLKAITTDQWRPLANDGSRGYQDYLGNVIMCDRQGYAWDPDKAVKALTSQYTAGGVRIERPCMDVQSCGVHNRHD